MPHSNRTRAYDILSRWYRLLSDPSEGPLRRECLDLLRLRPGEAVLEIGSGPGTDLLLMAERVGRAGIVLGLDLSRGMQEVSQRALRRGHHESLVRLVQGDGLRLPFRSSVFNIVQMSFTLELFSEHEIPRILREAARVMCGEGRLGLVCLSSRDPAGFATRAYWQAHRAFPAIIDCRPIGAPDILAANGYEVTEAVERSMWGLRVSVLVARKG
jgi:ubiquinone/menaquinone biosynthesis C-methylase UbiE